jgi:hypothetical protein
MVVVGIVIASLLVTERLWKLAFAAAPEAPVLPSDVLRLANSPLYRASPAPVETIRRAARAAELYALKAMPQDRFEAQLLNRSMAS